MMMMLSNGSGSTALSSPDKGAGSVSSTSIGGSSGVDWSAYGHQLPAHVLMSLSNRSQIAGVLAQLCEMDTIEDEQEGDFEF